jgi:hypothetical protein
VIKIFQFFQLLKRILKLKNFLKVFYFHIFFQILAKTSIEVPTAISDDQWIRYFDLNSLEDRCDLVNQLYVDERKTKASRAVQDERRPWFLKVGIEEKLYF